MQLHASAVFQPTSAESPLSICQTTDNAGLSALQIQMAGFVLLAFLQYPSQLCLTAALCVQPCRDFLPARKAGRSSHAFM